MADDAMHFRAAQFFEPLTTKSVRETIPTLWAIVYTGLPNTLVFGDGSQSRDTFVEICGNHDVE